MSTPEIQHDVEVESELSSLKAKLAHLEDALKFPGSKMIHPGEYFQRSGERQLRAWLERRQKATAGHDARELALGATKREREGLEKRLSKIEADCDNRLAQLDRSRQQIVDDYAAQSKEIRVALRELSDRVLQESAEAEAKPVSVTLIGKV